MHLHNSDLDDRNNRDNDGEEGDNRIEDDVEPVIIPMVDAMVVMDPNQVEIQVKGRMSDYIESYIANCLYATGSIPKACRYLRLLPGCMPFREVHIGQSSYSTSILPIYASAFAFNYTVTGSWTSTVQVLGQAMNSEFNTPMREALRVLANSYILAPRGMIFINVIPYERCDAQLHAKLESRVAELMANMSTSSAILGSKKVTFIEYGDDAKIAGDAFWASVKSASLPVSRVAVRNPVWVSRNFPNATKTTNPSPLGIATTLGSHYGSHHVSLYSNDLRPQPWRTYTRNQLSYVRPQVTMKLISSSIRSESIEQLEASFAKLVRTMSRKGTRVSGDEDESESYVHQVVRQIGEESQRQVVTARDALELAKSAISKVRKDDKESVEAMISVLRSCVDAQVVAAGFFSSLPSTMSSDTAALSLGVSTLPPIVRAYVARDEASQRPVDTVVASGIAASVPKPRLSLRKIGNKTNRPIPNVKAELPSPSQLGILDTHRNDTKKVGGYIGDRKEEEGGSMKIDNSRNEHEAALPASNGMGTVVLGNTTDGDADAKDPFSDYAQSLSTFESYSPGPHSVGLRRDATSEICDDNPFDYEDYAMDEGSHYPSVFPKRLPINATGTSMANREGSEPSFMNLGVPIRQQQQQQQQQQRSQLQSQSRLQQSKLIDEEVTSNDTEVGPKTDTIVVTSGPRSEDGRGISYKPTTPVKTLRIKGVGPASSGTPTPNATTSTPLSGSSKSKGLIKMVRRV